MAEFGFASDATLKELAAAQSMTNAYLAALAAEKVESLLSDAASMKRIAAGGGAKSIFGVGDTFTTNWTESVSSTSYSVPHHIASFDSVTLQDGESVPGICLQWHYATPLAIPFDAREAFYCAESGLAAGVYYFTIGINYGKCTSGSMYEFTLSSAVPQGGQIVFESDIYTNDPNATNVNVYSSSASSSPIETAALSLVTESAGTSLGDLTAVGSGSLNSLQRAIYGYNRWSQSAMRQWLNSSAGAGKWWSAQNIFDRPPEQAASYPGFMSGYDDSFLAAIQKVKVTTALNTVSDGGGSEDTYDYFFLPSLEQLYITPQMEGVEGSFWPYWKRTTGSAETIKTMVSSAFPLVYPINNKASAQSVRLRSNYSANPSHVWLINGSGIVTYAGSSTEYRSTPACVIC